MTRGPADVHNLTTPFAMAASKWETGGFYGAPVTKALCVAVLGAHIAMSNSALPDNLISLPLSVWKLFFGTIAFANLGEVVWSLPILYAFRGIERRMGSIKFASFCLLCSLSVLFTQVGLLHVFSFTKVASGPYAIIFGLFVLLCHDTQVVTQQPVIVWH